MSRTHVTEQWPQTPLCERYAAIFLGRVPITLRDLSSVDEPSITWALGTTVQGESEYLGAWAGSPRDVILEDLAFRGTKRIDFVFDDASNLRLRNARRNQTTIGNGRELFERRHAALQRAMRRHADFPDLDSARLRVVETLSRAQRRATRENRLARTAADQSVSSLIAKPAAR